ncbi:MAG: hypothetical protein EPN50_10075 [Chloroflexota bacterium]|nr:MAG: hypothetical protein EPN50_10075 [Chloroflexota bacterium]
MAAQMRDRPVPLLAKMDRSRGTSESQLRDCRDLVRLDPELDVDSIERFVDEIGVRAVWDRSMSDDADES